ncbi:transcriptional regulator with XRE-family HTH domain [Kineococcus radiotolerans]|uniref:Helix-turn-helix domain protein n=2 Tax=Kineococcus radiotolerans TaxID=131568 RepID=A6W836_KINRD|nr:helix-turn-helix transcriptional regulator [Kineococcus radiotolerans]ABS02975.1 helix-turn-helix domain protein [Kineococcus radiotolerans SRS30216 = ATCC BAA-149]MBB2899823.1 transcriptional regulator with XRE-family HTH domain [Kineococcus radiotolerans]
MVVLRRTIGDVLRDERRGQQRTLREVSSTARVSLGYLSEVERGQKEASSELLASICTALDVPLSQVLGEVTRRIAREEGVPAVGRRYAAEGVVPTPAVEAPVPLLPVVEGDTPLGASARAEEHDLDSLVDQAVDSVVDHAIDSALGGLAQEAGGEFAVELEGLPDELELILRRRLVSAA